MKFIHVLADIKMIWLKIKENRIVGGEALILKDKNTGEPAQLFLRLQRPQEKYSTTIQPSVTRFVYLYSFASQLFSSFILKCI